MDELSNEYRDILRRAGELAHQQGHEYIGTEPVLLALLEDPHGRVAEICTRHGVAPSILRADVVAVLRPGGPPRPGHATEPTPPLKQVLMAAREEASALGHGEVRAEHLLLAMLRQGADGNSVAGVLLARRGLACGMVRDALIAGSHGNASGGSKV
jgi:ATP-dependent Clp protease ATP-binding subunit ClpA